MKKILLIFIRLISHLVAIALLFWLFLPGAAKFLYSVKLLGADTAHFLYYTIEFSRRMPFPPMGWKMTWFEGTPQLLDYPWLNYYLIQPLVSAIGALPAVRIYLMGSIFIFLLFSYLLFFELSGGILLSLGLSTGLSYSWATYIQLYSAGVGLSSITQVAFPASIYFIVRYLKTSKRKFLGSAILPMSFGFYSHDLLAGFFAFIPALIILFFYTSEGERFFNRKKTNNLIFFGLGTWFLSFPPLMGHLLDLVTGINVAVSFKAFGAESLVKFKDLLTSTNIVFYLFLPLSFLGLLFGEWKNKSRLLLPFMAVLAYFLLFHLSYDLKMNPIIGVLFPHRSFWLLPVLLGSCISLLLKTNEKGKIYQKVIVWLIAVLVFGTSLLWDAKSFDPKLKVFGTFRDEFAKFMDKGPAAYDKQVLFERERNDFVAPMIKVFGTEDVNHRLYAYDPGVRLAWNMFSLIPQTHGYYHYFTRDTVDWLAWLFATISRENYIDGGIPEDVAKQQSLFLADWYGVKYIATFGSEQMDTAPHYYSDNEYVISKTATSPPSFMILSDEYVSPLAKAVNVPVFGFIGDDKSYDYFVRNLGILNYNSMYLIPVKLGAYIEDIAKSDLENVDGLVFYNYLKKGGDSGSYQRAWNLVEEFINSGGLVLVESGAECPEKYGEKVPDAFPIKGFKTGPLGTDWNVQTDFFDQAIFSRLAPLTYEGGVWGLSYVESESLLKPEAKVLLKQAGKTVVAEMTIGKGKIIWSGLNVIYRPLHHNETALAEDEILAGLLNELIPIEKHSLEFEFARTTPEKVSLSFLKGRGALLKENNYGGWTARAIINGKKIKLPILYAGTFFMYAPLPREYWDSSVTIEFIYKGVWYYWLFFLVAIATLIFLLDVIIFKQFVFNLLLSPVKKRVLKTHVEIQKKWNEEEY